jgi:hypothetical protein
LSISAESSIRPTIPVVVAQGWVVAEQEREFVLDRVVFNP